MFNRKRKKELIKKIKLGTLKAGRGRWSPGYLEKMKVRDLEALAKIY